MNLRRLPGSRNLIYGSLLMAAVAHAQYLRGVNISGAEFGQSQIPGVYNRDYTYQSETTFRYFSTRNLGLVRFPLMWERLQPALGGPLDPLNLSLLKSVIDWARADGARVILDIHNFGRYSIVENGKLNTYVIDQPLNGVIKVTRNHLADLWVRLSREFSVEPVVYAYDLMNEPHDMADWKGISQTVLGAIRGNGDPKLIMVPGDSWSSANRWAAVHGPNAWISDPAGNFMYEAHQYFDSDESGGYKQSYDAELRGNPSLPTLGSARLARFVDWCRANNVRGYLGEYGVPDSDPRWWAVLDDFLNALDAAQMNGTFWAAGEWWGSYPLSIQPTDSFTVDRPQLPTLLSHLPAGAFTSVSAAGNAGATFAPDSLMSGYGSGLPSDSAIQLTDSLGAIYSAPLLFSSPSQINFLIPAQAALGRVAISVVSKGQAVAQGTLVLERVAPTIFTTAAANGPAAALLLRVKPDGSRIYENPLTPIDFGDPGDRLYLSLYGTGWRNAVSPSAASLQIAGAALAISFLGAQPDFPGLDQIDAELPRTLAGAGLAAIRLSVDGKPANPATLVFK